MSEKKSIKNLDELAELINDGFTEQTKLIQQRVTKEEFGLEIKKLTTKEELSDVKLGIRKLATEEELGNVKMIL